MRKPMMSLALVLATSSALASYKQPYHVNLNAGLAIFDDESYLEDQPSYGASVAIYEQEIQKYALQFNYENMQGVAYRGIVLETDIERYSLNMLVDGEEELGITPYTLIGGGYETLSTVYEDYVDTKNQAFINLGIGFRYRMNDYFNITLEGKALGKLDSRSVDYVTKVGLDFMFGGKWKKKAPVIDALGSAKAEPIVQKREPIESLSKKVKEVEKKRWITPEIVAEVFDENQQDMPKKTIEVKKVEDAAIINMQEHLKALKIQMAKNEALLAQQLAKLEEGLAYKQKAQKDFQVKLALEKAEEKTKLSRIAKEKARLALLEKEAKEAHAKKMQVAKEKIAKAKALKAQEAQRVAAIEEAKRQKAERFRKARIAKQKKIEAQKRAEAKRIAAQKRQEAALEAKRVAEEKARVARELAEFKRQKAIQLAEEKRLAKEAEEKAAIAAQKAEQERVDVLYIRNGMVVFAD